MKNKNIKLRNQIIGFRVNAKEKEALDRWAESNHIGLATSIRFLCLKQVKEEGLYKD